MTRPIIVGVNTPGSSPIAVAPTETRCTFRILRSSDLHDLGGLRGVLTDPIFKGVLNRGSAELRLKLDHYPTELTFGNIVRISYPSGQIAGMWVYEGVATQLGTTNSYEVSLTPLVSELTNADFNANYSADTTQPNPPLGPQALNVPILAGIARTLHCSAGEIDMPRYLGTTTNIVGLTMSDSTAAFTPGGLVGSTVQVGSVSGTIVTNDAQNITVSGWSGAQPTNPSIYAAYLLFSYAYNNATAVDPLTQGVTFGGSTWWWYCDHVGVVSFRQTSPFTHVMTMGREIVNAKWEEDIKQLYNGQPVIGGKPANSTASLTAFATDTNPLNPYSVPSIGRRTAHAYMDSSLLDQNSVNAVASSLLNFAERVTRKKTIHVQGYTVRRPQPGDSIKLRISDPDPTGSVDSTVGPYLILEVTEYGATNSFDIVFSADMTWPLYEQNPVIAQQQALLSMIQNAPQATAVSPNGQTGSIGPGVVGGTSPGVTYSPVPSSPVGLAVTTGIDNVSQASNGYALVSWSANPANDVVTGYDIRWRKSTDTTNYYTQHVSLTQVKIGNLVPGFTYVFSVRAQNDLGTFSQWTADFPTTITIDSTAPAAPTGLVAYKIPRGAYAIWNGNTEPDLQGYMVQVSAAGGPFAALNPAPNLQTTATYTIDASTIGQGQLVGAPIVFRVAAVDMSGNQSPWSTASATIKADGVYIDELVTGSLTALGTITASGGLQTAASGPRVSFDNSGITLYDGTTVDHGFGAGKTMLASSQSGNLNLSGTFYGSHLTSNSPAGQPSMDIQMSGTPSLTVSDGATNRVVVGQIPGGYGMEVLDATGAAIWDTQGLIKVMSLIGLASWRYTNPSGFGVNLGGGPAYPDNWFGCNGSAQAVPNSVATFTLPRAGNKILVLSFISATAWRGSAGPAYFNNFIQLGTTWGETGYPINYGFMGDGTALNNTIFGVFSPPAGVSQAYVQAVLPSGYQFEYWNCQVAVFLLGN